MKHTKGEIEFLNILMSAWVAGWYAGRDDETTDDRKRIDCPEIMKRYSKQAAAPELLAACKDVRLELNLLLGLAKLEPKIMLTDLKISAVKGRIHQIEQAIAKAEKR